MGLWEVEVLGRGGLLTWTLSCVFWALLVVGRIILAKKPSSGLLACTLTRDLGRSCLSCPFANEAREGFFASVEVVEETLVRGCRIDNEDGFFVTDLRKSGSVGERCVSLAADDAVLAVAAAGSLRGLVGDLCLVTWGDLLILGDAGVFSFLVASFVGFTFVCVSNLGAGGALSCFAAECFSALACCACFAESMTPLIFAGPPLMLATGDVGVFGEGFETVGDLGAGFVGSLVGGGLMGCAVFVVCKVVAGGGPVLPLGFMFFTIVAALLLSVSLDEVDFGSWPCNFPDERASPRFLAFGVAEVALGAFEGVPGSAKEEPFNILPNPPSTVPLVEEGALASWGRVSCFMSESVRVVEDLSRLPPSTIAFS